MEFKKTLPEQLISNPENDKQAIFKKIEEAIDNIPADVIHTLDHAFLRAKDSGNKEIIKEWKSIEKTMDIIYGLAVAEDKMAYLDKVKLEADEQIYTKLPDKMADTRGLKKLLEDLSAYLSLKKPKKSE